MPRSRVAQPKLLTVHLPCCGAPVQVEYTSDVGGWERNWGTLPRCPRGHTLPYPITAALEDYLDEQANQGAGAEREEDADDRDE